MLAVVKKARTEQELFSVRGRVPKFLLKLLKSRYGSNLVMYEEEDRQVDIAGSDWYGKMEREMTPGKFLRVYRDNMGLTQRELGRSLRKDPKKISDYETGRRGISKGLALELSKFFGVPVEHFL